MRIKIALINCSFANAQSNTCLKYLSCGAERLAGRLQRDLEEARGQRGYPFSSSPPGVMLVPPGTKKKKALRCDSEHMTTRRRRGEDISRFYLILREESNVFSAVKAHTCLCPDHGEVLS